jgi:prepilin-type N-terminal cleavage/methylation domain-containing protein
MKHKQRYRYGFTLAEALLAMTILAVAAGGVLLPYAAGAAEQAEGARRTLAAKLASDKIEDIAREGFAVFSAKVGTTENELQGQVEDTNGVIFSGELYAGFSRAVSYESATTPFAYHPLIIVTVDVGYEGRNIVSVSTWLGDQ